MQGKSAVLMFIEAERAKGASDQQIQHKLLDAGWHMDIIQKAMNHREPVAIPVVKRTVSKKIKHGLQSKLRRKNPIRRSRKRAG